MTKKIDKLLSDIFAPVSSLILNSLIFDYAKQGTK